MFTGINPNTFKIIVRRRKKKAEAEPRINLAIRYGIF
jgi:hypothetical protein